MRLNPRYPPWYLFELGWAYRMTGRYAEAIATLKEAHQPESQFSGCPHSSWLVSYWWQWRLATEPSCPDVGAGSGGGATGPGPQ